MLDFGISKIVSDNDAQGSLTTKSGRMFGSPAYASPEQWRDAKNVDRRSDVWSFGVVLYEFLTGQLPFAAESAAMIAINVAAETPRPLRDLRGDIPADLEQIVLRCLEKNPDRRFDDIDELAQALRGCQSRFAVGARRGEQRVGWSATTTLPAAPSWWWIRSKALVRWFAAAMLLGLGWFSVRSYLQRPIRQPSSEEPAHFEPPQVEVQLPAIPSVAATAAPDPLPEPPPRPAPVVQFKPKVARPRRADAGRSVEPSECDPPYYFDERGNRIYKVDCL